MNRDVYEGIHLKLWIEDGILFSVYKTRELDLEKAEAAAKERLEYCQGITYPIVTDYRLVKSTTKEARDYFASEEASLYITALGVVIDSLVGKTMLNFYMKISKPAFPTRVFNDVESAIGWLNQYK